MHPADNYAPALLDEKLGLGSIKGPSCSLGLRLPAVEAPRGHLQTLGVSFFENTKPGPACFLLFSFLFHEMRMARRPLKRFTSNPSS